MDEQQPETSYRDWMQTPYPSGILTCPVCKADAWKPARPIAAAEIDQQLRDGRFETSPDTRTVLMPLVCQQCNYAVFFHVSGVPNAA